MAEKSKSLMLALVMTGAIFAGSLAAADVFGGEGSAAGGGSAKNPGIIEDVDDLENMSVVNTPDYNGISSVMPTDDKMVGRSNEVPEGLSEDEWGAIQGSIQKARYYLTWHEPSNGYVASNPAHGWGVTFNGGGVVVNPTSEDGWSWRLVPSNWGYLGHMVSFNSIPEAVVDDGRLEYRYSEEIVGWYVNDKNGIEHGFTITAPPQPRIDDPLVIEMSLDTSLTPKMVSDGGEIVFLDTSGDAVLSYSKLLVTDAAGRIIPAKIHLSEQPQAITITIGEASAVYPLTIDLLLTSEVKKLTASDGAADDWFGVSVSVSGDTIAVGANGDDVGANINQGSAYVFVRNQGGADNWGEVKKLTASDGTAGDQFGMFVSVSGDTIAVGASYDDVGANTNQGSAYVFVRNQGGADNWGEVKKLTASDGAGIDEFGRSVSVSGDTIIVGAPYDNVGANTDQGSAYVFVRNRGGADNWGEVKKLTASDGAAHNRFGESVSVSGDTIVVGAYYDDVGPNPYQGSAYVFVRNQGGADNWGEVKKLTASDGAADDWFGWSVSVSGDTIVVGAYGDDVAPNTDQGSAYVFVRNQGGADNWGEVKKLTASDGATDDRFGASVSVSGDTIVVGAYFDDVGANTDQGSAYTFIRIGNTWVEESHPTASDGAADDNFGVSVSVSGDAIVVGAYFDDVGANLNQGSAYVYYLEYVNNPPTITTTDVTTATEDVPYSVDYNAADIDGDTLTWSISYTDTDGWLTINPGTGVLSGTPDNSDVGTWIVNVTVDDGNGGIDWSNFTLVIKPDTDGDGVPDDEDAFPNDPEEWEDTDSDGVGDNSDAFPDDPAASVDTDGDGKPDDWNTGYTVGDSTTGLVLDDDDDNDSVPDAEDPDTLDPNVTGKGGLRDYWWIILIIIIAVIVALLLAMKLKGKKAHESAVEEPAPLAKEESPPAEEPADNPALPSPKPAAPIPQPAKPAPPLPTDERIARLKKAYDEGRITKEMYEKNLKRFTGGK
ncbi:MAG: putative Ig domain-containing protein [Candidatus Thermoplasmatota archaeon]